MILVNLPTIWVMECFSYALLGKVLEGLVFNLRRIYNTDSKFKIRSNDYQQYLIGRDYKSPKVSKRFSKLAKLLKTARQIRVKIDFKSNFVQSCTTRRK